MQSKIELYHFFHGHCMLGAASIVCIYYFNIIKWVISTEHTRHTCL